MESVTQVAQVLKQVLETEAHQIARETGWQRRLRKRKPEPILYKR